MSESDYFNVDIQMFWYSLALRNHNGLISQSILYLTVILYESHSVLHGRPFPLKGRYYANV